ncbi:MAG TPA: hypothetical protein VE842_09450 [Pyrinomonadaceae bacterium]|jgi:hypothetical protein|nr:hypothetical protein [Pyrinomonadaceae bacterium]
MFDEWKKRRGLLNKIDSIQRKLPTLREKIPDHSQYLEVRFKLQRELNYAKFQLDALDTRVLLRKAQRLGLEIPMTTSWWWNDNEDGSLPPEAVSHYLTDIGKAGARKLIKDERRKNVEWWVKIIVPVLTAIISLFGLIVALVTVSRK